MVIKDLRTAAEAINEAADTLAEMFSSPAETPAPTEADKPTLTLDDVSCVLMPISRMSREHSQKLRAVVQKYGADKLSEIDPKHYAAILAEAEVIRNGG